jgi:hypothetical protein
MPETIGCIAALEGGEVIPLDLTSKPEPIHARGVSHVADPRNG